VYLTFGTPPLTLFCRLLNTSILSAMIMQRNNTGEAGDKVSLSTNFSEGMFVMHVIVQLLFINIKKAHYSVTREAICNILDELKRV
jgi:hypothetical protein